VGWIRASTNKTGPNIFSGNGPLNMFCQPFGHVIQLPHFLNPLLVFPGHPGPYGLLTYLIRTHTFILFACRYYIVDNVLLSCAVASSIGRAHRVSRPGCGLVRSLDPFFPGNWVPVRRHDHLITSPANWLTERWTQ
jgi:hypothetical protein